MPRPDAFSFGSFAEFDFNKEHSKKEALVINPVEGFLTNEGRVSLKTIDDTDPLLLELDDTMSTIHLQYTMDKGKAAFVSQELSIDGKYLTLFIGFL